MIGQLRSAARFIARGLRARGSADPPRRGQSVERSIRPTAPELQRYLRATAGEALLPALEERAMPPLYHCTWETVLALELLSRVEPALPLGAMVHAETELLIARPIRLGDRTTCRVQLERAEAASNGLRLEVLARNRAAAGQLCTEARHRFRLRTGSGGARPESAPIDLVGWREAAAWTLTGAAGRRYARASGDWNPIHLHPWTARPLGFRRPILHGFCLAAMVAHAVCVDHWSSDPTALRRFRIAFRAPLALPGEAVLWLRGPAFRVTDPKAERLYAEGEAGGSDR